MDKLRDIQSPKTESERNRKYEQNDYQEWNWITGFPVLVAKTLDKIPAGQIQQDTERIIHYDEEWVSECEWVWVCVCVRVCVGGGWHVWIYPRMQVLFNIHKSINILYITNHKIKWYDHLSRNREGLRQNLTYDKTL